MISVVIPAYNSKAKITECLVSLKNQSYNKPYEIIVVDDGSTDNTAKEAKKSRDVRVIRQENAGPAKARNTGAKAAKGEIILFTDADCIADPDWISQMLKPFGDKKVVGVQGRYKTRQNGIVPIFTQLEIEQRYEKMKMEKSIDFIGSYSAAYRKDVFLKFNGFDESFPTASGEDPELSFRIAKAGHKMVFNPHAVTYHTHSTSLGRYLKSRYVRGYWGRLLYKKHPDMKKKGSSKGSGFFVGIASTCIMTFLLAVSYVVESVVYQQHLISLLILIVLCGIVLYESMYFMVKNSKMIVAGPVIVYLRNISIGLGIASGIRNIR